MHTTDEEHQRQIATFQKWVAAISIAAVFLVIVGIVVGRV